MSPEYLKSTIVRDLKAARREVEAYPDEKSLWRLPPGIANCGGTLALHIAGNLQHFFGAVLDGSGYVRDRAGEFAKRDVPRTELVAQIEATIAAVERGAGRLTPAILAQDIPEPVGGHRVATEDWLIHLVAHLGYHLGQLDYHRRLVTGQGTAVGTMAVPELQTARKIA